MFGTRFWVPMVHPLRAPSMKMSNTLEQRNKLSKQMGYPVKYIIPNEYLLVSEAADNGRMAVTRDPDSQFSKAVENLADSIIAGE